MSAFKDLLDALSGLGHVCAEAYVYGSRALVPDSDADLDVMFIITDKDRNCIISEIARIQSSSPILIHPVLVTKREFIANPYFSDLLDRRCVRIV